MLDNNRIKGGILREIEIYRQYIQEYFCHTFSITIHSKNSEINGIEYDLMCVLYDAIHKHPNFKNVKINDYRIVKPIIEIQK